MVAQGNSQRTAHRRLLWTMRECLLQMLPALGSASHGNSAATTHFVAASCVPRLSIKLCPKLLVTAGNGAAGMACPGWEMPLSLPQLSLECLFPFLIQGIFRRARFRGTCGAEGDYMLDGKAGQIDRV